MLSSCSYTLSMINLDTKPCPHFRFFSQHNRQSLCHSCFISLAWAIENTPSPLALNQCMEMEQQKRRVKSNEDLICKIWHSFHIFFCSFTSYYQRKDYCVRRKLHGEHCCWNQSVFLSGHLGRCGTFGQSITPLSWRQKFLGSMWLTYRTYAFISAQFLSMGRIYINTKDPMTKSHGTFFFWQYYIWSFTL